MKHKIAETNKFDTCVKKALVNELKYRLRSIKPNIRELIVLEYWGNLTDAEVG